MRTAEMTTACRNPGPLSETDEDTLLAYSQKRGNNISRYTSYGTPVVTKANIESTNQSK